MATDTECEVSIETVLRSLFSQIECYFSMSTKYYAIKKKKERDFKTFTVLIN